MKKIFQQLTEYKNVIDGLSTLYQAEKDQFEEELNQMQGKYTEEYIKQCRRSWTPKTDYASKIKSARTKHQSAATEYFNEMKKEIDTFFRIPVDPSFSATITAIKALGLSPSNMEFELLQEASGGYWGFRLLNELAISRTKTGQVAVLEDGKPKIVKEDVKIPYATKLPDIQGIYDALQAVKNSITIGFESYCGIGYALKDIVFPPSKTDERTGELLEKEYGLAVEPSKPDALTISKMASSVRCFNEDYSSYANFFEVMEDLATSMPEVQRKTTLTNADKELIDILIDSKYKFSAELQAAKIAKADSRLAELLLLDERYSEEVEKALEGVANDE